MLLRTFFIAVSLFLLAPAAQAQVTIIVQGLDGQLPDADSFLDGETDGYIRVFVESNYLGMTSIISNDNNPTWPESFQILLNLDAQSTPTATIELEVWDSDSGSDEFLGLVTYEYDWVAGTTVSTALPLNGPLGNGLIGIRVLSQQEPVAVEDSSFGELKSKY